MLPFKWYVNRDRRRAVADRLGQIDCLAVHRQVVADGRVVAAVLAVRLEYPRMGSGVRGSSARDCSPMHEQVGFVDTAMLTPAYYDVK